MRQLERRQVRDMVMALLPLAVLAAVTYRWQIASFFRPGGPRDQAAAYLGGQFAASPVEVMSHFTALMAFALGQGWLLACVAVLGIILAVRERQWAVAVLPASVLSLAATLSLLRVHPFGPSRHSLYLLPLLVLPVAHALSRLLRSRRPWSFALQPACLALLALPVTRQHVRMVETELNVPRAEAARIREFIAGDGARVRVFLTDQQTYWLLRPLLHLAGSAGNRAALDAYDIRLVTREGRSFVVMHEWRMVGDPRAARGKNHLAWMLERLRRHDEWRRALENEEVWVLQGGLGQKLLPGLPEAHAGQPLRSAPVGGAEFFAFRLYPTQYGAYVAAESSP
jgi:hypothetical protein